MVDEVKAQEQPQMTKEQMVNTIVNNATTLINREVRLMVTDLINILVKEAPKQ